MENKNNLRFNQFTLHNLNLILSAEVACILVLLAWLYSFWPTITSIYTDNISQPENPNIFFVIVAAAFVAWHNRNNLARITPCCAQSGLLILLCLTVWWGFSFIANREAYQQLSVILLLPAIVFTTTGYRVTKKLFLPLLLLFFIMPFGQTVYIEIQTLIENILSKFMMFAGASTKIQIKILDTTTKGLVYITSYVFMGLIISTLVHTKALKIMLGTAGFMVLPVGLNIVSILLFAWFGNIENYTSAYSWIAVSLGLILSVCCVFLSQNRNIVVSKFPELNFLSNLSADRLHWLNSTIIACCILLMMPWVAENIKHNPWQHKNINILQYAPYYVPDWTGPFNLPTNLWQPSFVGATKTVTAMYKNQTNSIVYLYTAYFAVPLDTNGLTDPNNKLYEDQIWTKAAEKTITIAINQSFSITLKEQLLSFNGTQRMLWSWYYVGTYISPSYDIVNLLENVRIISKIADHSGIVAVLTEINDSPDEARDRLHKFLTSLYPQIQILMNPVTVTTE